MLKFTEFLIWGGLIFTALGVIATGVGTIFQNRLTKQDLVSMNDTLTDLNHENMSLVQKSIDQAAESEQRILQLQEEKTALLNAQLQKSEEELTELKMPKLDVVDYQFYKNADNINLSYFTIKVYNSGHENCNSLALFIEDKNSPLFNKGVLQRLKSLPNGRDKTFRIYPFIDVRKIKSEDIEKSKEYQDFVDSFLNKSRAVMVRFCIHYEWDGIFYRTDSYHMMKDNVEPWIFFSKLDGARSFSTDELDDKWGAPLIQFEK
ncbi:hypothetical protein [Draconibacterium orientale]|uniref:hypothetical protein n=1 Tax=Draconibacterium orientale TaxID=1168034 RepID=UPI002A0A8780|nr:hypothetical protein [Draconibacterium orientale]